MTQATDDINKNATALRGFLGLVTEEEMAQALLLTSVGTLATWRSQGKGPRSVKLGKRVFYTANDLGLWVVAESKAQAEAKALAAYHEADPDKAAA